MSNKGKKLLSLLLAIIVSITVLIPAMAAESDDWRTVRVAIGINNSLYYDENGEVQGYCSEYINQLAKINHWNIEYVEGSWTDSVQNLYDGRIDILFPAQKTDERIGKMGFSSAIGGYQPIGLFAKADSPYCYDDYEAFNGARIAVSAGTSNEACLLQYAKENNFTYEPVYMNSTPEKLQALEDGTVDMIVFSTLNDVDDGKVVAMLDYLPFYYCTRIDDTELLEELDYGMNQLLIRNADLVQQVFYSFMNGNVSFAYTKAEEQAIKKKGKITVGVYEDTSPLFDVDDGEYHGIYVDLIYRIEELSGLDVEIRPLDRKEYAFDYLDKGDIDFVLGSSDQALKYSDATKYVQSEGIMDYYTIAITKANASFSELDNMTFALTGGRRYWASMINKNCPNASIKYYENSKECLDAVEDGDADITLLNTWEYNYQSKNERFQNLVEWESSRTLSETVFVSLESEDPLIRSVIDKSIEQISNAEKEKIITANLNNGYDDYNFKDRVYAMKNSLAIIAAVFVVIFGVFFMYVFMRKRNVAALKIKNMQLASANEAKDRFLSRMSHELRTPLNAISGYTSVVEQNIDDPDVDRESSKTNLKFIHQAVNYQLAIIGDLLDIQKIENGRMELIKTEIDAASYMDEIVSMIRPEAEQKNITFTYERLTKVNDTYFIDGVRFQQVLLNVLHNAVKFTPEGGKVKLTVDVIDKGEKSNTLKFVISDNGIGISEEFQRNYLFKRFAQEYGDNTSPYEGCGMGLAFCKEVMHLMGGDITCESVQGVGSTFTIIFVAEHITKSKRIRQPLDYSQYDLSGLRVLLCEDNPMNQDMERKLLEKMNCQVDIADDGVVGLRKFQGSDTGYYDIVLMDIRMPNMDGWECTTHIRALDREDARTIPIIAVSANAFEEDVEKSLEVGMNEHLAKPVAVTIMYEKIKKYCSK